MIQIIAKVDEVLSHILNLNWLYHFNYNWKVWFMWFQKKHMNKFFIETIIIVLKKIFCWKITFIWKMTRIMSKAFVSKSILYMFIKTLDEIKEKLPPEYTKIYPKYTFSCLKWGGPPPIVCFHPIFNGRTF
jgi:hypothetical protein